MNLGLFYDACAIMFIGMGIVFSFLVIMIFAMNIGCKVIQILNKYFPEEIKETTPNKKKKQTTDDTEIAIAIALAAQRSGLW